MSSRLTIRANSAVRRFTPPISRPSSRFGCQCNINGIAAIPPTSSALNARFFSATPTFLKKNSKAKGHHHAKVEEKPLDQGPPAGLSATDEAFDFSGLETKILKATEHLSHELSQLRAGGRFNPELVENLQVQLDKDSSQKVKLKDIAQVVPKGRFVHIILSEEAHIKAVRSAISASEHSVTPQGPTPEAPTTLTIAVPPPTAESRQVAVEQASKIAENTLHRIREARGAQQKKYRAMQVARTVRPDDLQKAHILMEDVVKRGNSDVKSILEGVKKVLEG